MTRAPRVLIVSASMGAGHDVVANELARRLTDAGAEATVVDLLGLAGSAGRRLRRTYSALLHYAPWLYGGAMRLWSRWPRPLETFTAANAAPFEAALAAAVSDADPDAIVSVYNMASQCLGRMARRNEIRVPVATIVVDAGPHPYWVSPAVALHLVPADYTARRLAQYGARGLLVAAPLLRPEFTDPPSRAVARERLGLPQHERIALINAGSWAVGGLRRPLAIAGEIEDLTCIVLCGRDEQLRARLRHRPRTRAVGWTRQMPEYLSAADIVIDNAGGQTCREAHACGTPLVIFRPLPGHGRANALALERTGTARYARSSAELADLLRGPVPVPTSHGSVDGADSVAAILQLASAERGREAHAQSMPRRG